MNTIDSSRSPAFDFIQHFQNDRFAESHDFGSIDFSKIPSLLRALLFSDGTVTRILEAYYWEPLKVEILFHGDCSLDQDLPLLGALQGDRLLHRRVLIRGTQTNRVYEFAKSYLRTDLLWPGVKDDLMEGRLGLGELFQEKRIESYRELLELHTELAGELGNFLGTNENDELACRSYRIWVSGKPALWIEEKFPFSHFNERD